MKKEEIEKTIKLIKHISKTEVMPLFRKLNKEDIREKNPGDFVTIADENSEAAFSKFLPEIIPNSLIVGEEAVAKKPNILDKLQRKGPIWLIDPIDGTYNYKTGNENFGILITLLNKGKAVAAFCYDAPKDECFYAIKNEGVYNNNHDKVTLNISNDIISDVRDIHGLVGYNQLGKLEGSFGKLSRIRCSLHMTLKFMKSEADFILWHSITPWDNAGCSLLIEELGAYIAYIDGTKYSPIDNPCKSLLLAAKNINEWREISRVITEVNARKLACS